MSQPQDPKRLLDAHGVRGTPLGDLLATAKRDVPSTARVQSFVDELERAITAQAPPPKVLHQATWLRVVLGALVGAAGVMWWLHEAPDNAAERAVSNGPYVEQWAAQDATPRAPAARATLVAKDSPAPVVEAITTPVDAGQTQILGADAQAGIASKKNEDAAPAITPSARAAARPARVTMNSPARPPAASASSPRTQHVAATTVDGAPTEIALVARARRLLQVQPQQTLVLLAEHRQRYPHGELSEEREFLTLEAQQRLGFVALLREGARSFLRTFPGSWHREQVEQLLRASD